MVGRSTTVLAGIGVAAGRRGIFAIRDLFRKRDLLRVLEESDTAPVAIVIDANRIASTNLSGRHQIRERMHQRLVDSALQMTCAILEIRALT